MRTLLVVEWRPPTLQPTHSISALNIFSIGFLGVSLDIYFLKNQMKFSWKHGMSKTIRPFLKSIYVYKTNFWNWKLYKLSKRKISSSNVFWKLFQKLKYWKIRKLWLSCLNVAWIYITLLILTTIKNPTLYYNLMCMSKIWNTVYLKMHFFKLSILKIWKATYFIS